MLDRGTTTKRDEALAAWLRKKGRPVPERAERTEPDLDADLQPIFRCWVDLMDGRQVGNGEALTWSEVSRWCEDHDITGEARRRWCRLVKGMDRVYVAAVNTRSAHGDTGAGSRRDEGGQREPGRRGGAQPRQDGG